MNIINSTESLFASAKQKVENAIHHVEADLTPERKAIENDVKSDAAGVESAVEKDTSRLVHEFHVTKLAVGKDITIRLDSAIGEVKRIVLNGETTVENIVTQIRSLAAKV